MEHNGVEKYLLEDKNKSSMEILEELFSTFDAKPPLIIKKEKSEKKQKKKKKHKHKDKKHKKKDKKKKRHHSNSSKDTEDESDKTSIKQEKVLDSVEIKLEPSNASTNSDIVKKEADNRKNTNFTESESNELKGSEKSQKKIVIKDLKFSSLFASTILKLQEKEKNNKTQEIMSDISEASNKSILKSKKRKRKTSRKHSDDKLKDIHKKRKHKSYSIEIKDGSEKRTKQEKHEEKYKHVRKYDDKDKHSTHSKVKKTDEHRSRSDKHWEKYEHRPEELRMKVDLLRDRSFYKNDDFYRSSDRDRSYDREKGDKLFISDRYRSDDRDKERRYRDKSFSKDDRNSYIDKKKLLEIARKNAIEMMKSGSLPGTLTLGPQVQEKVIAAIKAGGKTVEELTNFCKTLSRNEEMGELSSAGDDNCSDSENDKAFHHPFQIKDRPTSITINIRNSVPLPTKSTQERSSELRLQFPVSSGQQHRKTESHWVPVETKKNNTPSVLESSVKVPIHVTSSISIPPEIIAVSTTSTPPNIDTEEDNSEITIDIGSIVSQRLTAMRKLQENPHDVQALTQMYRSSKEVQTWAESKQQTGQFTGSTGVNFLTQAELSSGYHAWAKKDQLLVAAPVSGGMGMHLLQKMGWKPGEGLGKEKTGALEPLLLEVKLDKKGLVATDEQKKRKPKPTQVVAKSTQGKHPVSLLGEYASKKKIGAPQYILCFECGPDHKKNFLFKVILNGEEYKPNIASPNKKEAKANAATLCLQKLGMTV